MRNHRTKKDLHKAHEHITLDREANASDSWKRTDFLPSEYIKELQRLQENVPAFSFQEVQATLETAFEAPLLQRFASLAQVHFAVLPDGSLVEVKVQRPGI